MNLLIIVLTFAISWCDGYYNINNSFLKLGEYEYDDGDNTAVKSYYSSRDMHSNWMQAYETCRSYDMNLVELPSRDEHDFFLALCQRNTHQMIGDNYAIGGSSAGTGRFYWMTTRQSVNYPLRFSPGEPNNLNNNEVYLNVFKSPGGFVFNDVGIGSILNFICQSIQYTRKPLTTTTRRTTTTILPPIVPTELPNWPKCDPGSVEKFPHPTSCYKYIRCFSGKPIEKTCAANLQFSVEKKQCSLIQYPCCPQVDDVDNPVYLNNFDECSKYYICSSGKAIGESCAEGLHFDIKSNLCTLPDIANCIDPRP